jgi:hypothetical protein
MTVINQENWFIGRGFDICGKDATIQQTHPHWSIHFLLGSFRRTPYFNKWSHAFPRKIFQRRNKISRCTYGIVNCNISPSIPTCKYTDLRLSFLGNKLSGFLYSLYSSFILSEDFRGREVIFLVYWRQIIEECWHFLFVKFCYPINTCWLSFPLRQIRILFHNIYNSVLLG